VEDGIAAYTMRAVDDERTLNKTLYMRPPMNVVSHNELISVWEKKAGRTCRGAPPRGGNSEVDQRWMPPAPIGST